MSRTVRTRVIIVGAGFCGLSAATALAQAGVEVLVLEARERVGGRAESVLNGLGERIDTGGQFLCQDMPEAMGLATRSGRQLVTSPVEGEMLVQPPFDGEDALYDATMAIRDAMDALDPDDPAIFGLSVDDWLAARTDAADAKLAFHSMIEGLWCQPIGRVPLWYLVSNDRRITNEVSELQYFPAGTMHALAEDLAAGLGKRVRLGAAVTRIERGAGGVRVLAGDLAVEADAVIVAVPPVMASRIAFSPSLPVPLSRALGAWSSGTVVKLAFRHAEPFWRRQGLSGMVFWRDIHGLFACDASPDEAHATLVAFVGGPLAVEWGAKGEAWLVATVTERLAAALGPQARDALDVTLRDWTGDPWSGGAYSDIIVDMDARDAEALIRKGAPPVHFACSEVALSFPGYVEGAIVAGKAVAARVMAGLAGR